MVWPRAGGEGKGKFLFGGHGVWAWEVAKFMELVVGMVAQQCVFFCSTVPSNADPSEVSCYSHFTTIVAVRKIARLQMKVWSLKWKICWVKLVVIERKIYGLEVTAIEITKEKKPEKVKPQGQTRAASPMCKPSPPKGKRWEVTNNTPENNDRDRSLGDIQKTHTTGSASVAHTEGAKWKCGFLEGAPQVVNVLRPGPYLVW